MSVLKFVVIASLIILSGALSSARSLAADIFDPKTTYGVISGVLSWKDTTLSSYPTKNRKDEELYNALMARGASQENLALLTDGEATKASIMAAVKEMSAKAPQGSTFIFYYAGHGINLEGKGAFFANFDIDSNNPAGTGLSPQAVGEIIKQNFKGGKVILLADCCYSGVLQGVAQKLNTGKLQAAAITSASASNASTGNWTFSQTVIDAIAGRPILDLNGNGSITLAELSQCVTTAMRFRERQMAGSSIPPQMSELLIADDRGSVNRASAGGFSTGDFINASYEGTEKPAQILDIKGESLKVEFYNYSDKIVDTIPLGSASKIEFATHPVGKSITVMWNGKPYSAKIQKIENGFHWITYPGWSHSWDEWVMSDRIVEGSSETTSEKKNTNQPKDQNQITNSGKPSDQISVEWQGNCYPASILKRDGKKAFIHYEGYEASWDEWVGPERMNCK